MGKVTFANFTVCLGVLRHTCGCFFKMVRVAHIDFCRIMGLFLFSGPRKGKTSLKPGQAIV